MTFAAALVVISLTPWPDPFDATFLRQVPKAGAAQEVEFRPAPAREWVHAVRRMAASAPGKEQYVQFLKDQYGYNIGPLNEAYGIEAGSFTELLTYDYRRLDTQRPAVRRDDEAFLKILVAAVLDAARQKR
ncbi:MAG: hypothetical protein HYX27_15680 [Acidobacteria bacterium]|nr:hypothetical protein [Acidobacteriota bacterium]